jgi:hypothetical protein
MSEPVRKEPVMETITTKGVAMSRLGFGTFRMPGAAAQSVVESALALGYRLSTLPPCTRTRRRSAPPLHRALRHDEGLARPACARHQARR